jgi:hypothetical protein
MNPATQIMFAQVPTALEFGGWMICAAAAISMLNNGGKFLDRFKSKPAAEQLAQSDSDLSRRVDTMEVSLSRFVDDQSERRRAIYEKIDEMKVEMNKTTLQISKDVSALDNNVRLINSHLAAMDSKMDRFMERRSS